MSSLWSSFSNWGAHATGFSHVFGSSGAAHALGSYGPGKPPPAPPGPPNVNDAANASQEQLDQLRMRRGMLANIYAGAMNQQPVTGKTELGA
jgi:hypothetical protein